MTPLVDPEHYWTDPCPAFTPDKGGAHPWCAICGWQEPEHCKQSVDKDEQ